MVDSFGDALRQLRQDRGWSQAKLARLVRYSRPLITQVEIGLAVPTPEFADRCDQAFGTTPVLSTLCGLTGEDDDVRRRALAKGFAAAVGLGALGSYAALADALRIDLQEAAGIEEDWDAILADYRHRLVVEPSATFGDELLAKMLTARQQIVDTGQIEVVRASAHLAMIYGVWAGYQGSISTGHNYYRTARVLAERSRDRDTQVWVLARTASAGPYQGLGGRQTQDFIDEALALAGDRPSTGALEAYGAQVHLAALNGDLTGGRAAVRQMYELAEKLPDIAGASPLARAVSFDVYLEGKLGSVRDADTAMRRAHEPLSHLPQWLVEAQLYWALAIVRHGHHAQGLEYALKVARSMRYSVRVHRLAVDDILTALPKDFRNDLTEQLALHATTGPKPWELIQT